MCPQMKLNARQVETAKPKDKTYKMADGGGLYLEVSAKGSKYWRMKYRRPSDKKEDRLAFGVWPTVTLAQARAKRDEAKKLLVQGIDPKAEQKEAQAENSGNDSNLLIVFYVQIMPDDLVMQLHRF